MHTADSDSERPSTCPKLRTQRVSKAIFFIEVDFKLYNGNHVRHCIDAGFLFVLSKTKILVRNETFLLELFLKA